METKLFVGNLPYKMTNEDLQSLFEPAGKVLSATVIFDKQTGRSRGFGFVEMGSPEDMKNGIKMFDGQEYEGRKLVVNEARPRRDNDREE